MCGYIDEAIGIKILIKTHSRKIDVNIIKIRLSAHYHQHSIYNQIQIINKFYYYHNKTK